MRILIVLEKNYFFCGIDFICPSAKNLVKKFRIFYIDKKNERNIVKSDSDDNVSKIKLINQFDFINFV